jgi:hypothetical protein
MQIATWIADIWLLACSLILIVVSIFFIALGVVAIGDYITNRKR